MTNALPTRTGNYRILLTIYQITSANYFANRTNCSLNGNNRSTISASQPANDTNHPLIGAYRSPIGVYRSPIRAYQALIGTYCPPTGGYCSLKTIIRNPGKVAVAPYTAGNTTIYPFNNFTL